MFGFKTSVQQITEWLKDQVVQPDCVCPTRRDQLRGKVSQKGLRHSNKCVPDMAKAAGSREDHQSRRQKMGPYGLLP